VLSRACAPSYRPRVPLWLFELACVPVLAIAIALSARRVGARTLAIDYGLLALAGFLGEESCIRLYDHYHYADGWHARLDEVPLLVPLIWPLVILSAREVRTALFPALDPVGGAFAVFALVALDASMVEVVAVRAELWRWAEPGHLGVPILGILGWGFFAGAADLGMTRWKGWDRVLVLPFALIVAHALIVISWWACFRWTLRGDLGVISFVVLVGLSILAGTKALELRRAGRTIPLAIASPRVIAASLFFTLLVTTAPLDVALWLHVVTIAVPYVLASELPRRSTLLSTAPAGDAS
jgi:hypothetical protein